MNIHELIVGTKDKARHFWKKEFSIKGHTEILVRGNHR